MWNLKNKKVLVTGGTKGIGKATVYEFLELGASVLFNARNNQEVKAFELELKQKKFNATGIVADISIKEDQEKLSKWIESNWASLDILVNNAGYGINKPLNELTSEDYKNVVDTILIAPFEILLLMYPLLLKGNNSSVINVASVAGILNANTGLPYAASKAGLIHQTKCLAAEWAKDGIRVNSISPWFTDTPRAENLLKNKLVLNKILDRTPLKRVAKSEEIASVIAFLAMDKSSYITGQNIIIDGGMSINAM